MELTSLLNTLISQMHNYASPSSSLRIENLYPLMTDYINFAYQFVIQLYNENNLHRIVSQLGIYTH